MRILLVSQWYPPEPQKVVSDLAESLRNEGFEVTVLTGFPNYPEGRIHEGYRRRVWMRETINGIPILRAPLFANHSRSPLLRAANYLSFALSAIIFGLWLSPRADLIYVVHPPLTIAAPAWFLSRLRRTPFVYEIQDMWPETLRATGMVNSERVLGLVGWFAKRVYPRAAGIRVISQGFKENLIEKGVAADKIRVFSNWVDTSFYHPEERDEALAESLGLKNRFNVMFAGAIGLAQGLETVLDAAEQLRDAPEVQFVLVGDGVDADRLRSETVRRGLSNVRMLGRYPAKEMSRLYALADVLLLHLNDDPLFRITVPHKTFAYLATGKPILAAVAGDAARVIEESEAGLTCPPGDAKKLSSSVRRFYALPPSERQRLGANGLAAARQRYSREAVAGSIAGWLRELLDAETPSSEPIREAA